MAQQVRAADGRYWTVRRKYDYDPFDDYDDFKHQFGSGVASFLVLGFMLSLAVILLLAWRPSTVATPGIVVFIITIVVLFFPLRWGLRRPWDITAEAVEQDGQPAEVWEGRIRGVFLSAQEQTRIARSIRFQNTPPIDGSMSIRENVPEQPQASE